MMLRGLAPDILQPVHVARPAQSTLHRRGLLLTEAMMPRDLAPDTLQPVPVTVGPLRSRIIRVPFLTER
jgi:hypothetical protein